MSYKYVFDFSTVQVEFVNNPTGALSNKTDVHAFSIDCPAIYENLFVFTCQVS